jgi:hypothetical protein
LKDGTSKLGRLRRAPTKLSATSLTGALERVREILALGVGDLDLSWRFEVPDPLAHVSESRARIADLMTSICAVLIAEARNPARHADGSEARSRVRRPAQGVRPARPSPLATSVATGTVLVKFQADQGARVEAAPARVRRIAGSGDETSDPGPVRPAAGGAPPVAGHRSG